MTASVLFRIRFRRLDNPEESYFDVTTPVLVNVALACLPRGARVVDMGTGPFATVGLALWRHHGCEVISVDVNEDSVRLARQNVAVNRAPVEVVASRFFDAVADDFDAVVFNPPYVPSAVGDARGLTTRFRAQWDGGSDGTEVIRDFIVAVASDARRPLAIMGVNRSHVPSARLRPLLHAALVDVVATRSHPVLPVDVYVFRGR